MVVVLHYLHLLTEAVWRVHLWSSPHLAFTDAADETVQTLALVGSSDWLPCGKTTHTSVKYA